MHNPLLEKITSPGETFQLPSQGLFYTDELSEEVVNGEVYVNPMTTIDEIYMKTPDKLLNGTAVEQVFRHCIPMIKKPLDLFSNDVDFLLTCLRKVTYGPTVSIEYTHDCEEAKNHTYEVDIHKFIKETQKIDPSSIEQATSFSLPNGQVVHIQPLRYRSIIRIYQNLTEASNDPIKIANNLAGVLTDIITQVDDTTDKTMIDQWVKSLRADWFKQIQKQLEKLGKWGTKFEETVICKDCQENIILSAPLNPINFFTQL